MRSPGFYHSILPALLLAWGLGGGAIPALANSGEPLSEALPVVPPRSINDITRMLAHYKPNQAEIDRYRALADASPPSAAGRGELFEFYWNRGMAAAELGRVPQEIADLRKAREYMQHGSKEAARMLRNLGTAEAQGGNILSALKFFEEGMAHIPRNSFGQFTGAYAQLVSAAAQLGDFEAAERNLRELEGTMSYLKSRPTWNAYQHSWLTNYERARGDFFRMSGRFLEAEGAYRKALQEAQATIIDIPQLMRLNGDAPTVETMNMVAESIERLLAASLLAQGKIVEAEAMSRTALRHSLERTGNASVDVGRGLGLLSTIIGEQGRYQESNKLIEASIEALLASGAAEDALPVLDARRAAVAVQVSLGRYKEALQIYDQMQKSVEKTPDLAKTALRGDLDVTLAYMRTGAAGAAEKMLSKMLESSRQRYGGKALRTAEILAFHAMSLADLGNLPSALDEFRSAVPILLEQARQDGEAETGSIRKQQRLVVILERYIRLLGDLAGKADLPPGFDPVRESFLLADIARGSSVQRALTRSAARAAIKDSALAELARQEQDTQRRANSLSELLTQLLSAPPDQQLPAIQAKIRTDVNQLRQNRDRLRKEIEQKFPEYARLVDPPPVGLGEVQKLLRPGEVMVSWYFGEHSAHVWAVGADGRQRFANLPISRSELAAEVSGLRRALNPDAVTVDQIPPFDVAAAHGLYKKLLGPVEELTEDAKTLLAVPHAELGQLPLSLLVTASVQRPAATGTMFAGYRHVPWLMRRQAITQLPSVTALASLRRLPAANGERLPFIGFGDPFFSEEQARLADSKTGGRQVAMRGVPLKLRNVPKTGGVDSAELALLPRLPDTAEEILEVAAALGADPSRDVFLQRAASEKKVFETKLNNRRIVMFATHGLVPGELDGLSQPALALSAPKVAGGGGDGLLTQEKILSLDLNADWVVLSACNTAAGDGSGAEAVSGLGRAFFYAGARALLVSNWPVETEASRKLMTDLFRRQSADSGLTKAEALRQAMADMVDGPGKLDAKSGKAIFSYAHPLFWAPFVLVGD